MKKSEHKTALQTAQRALQTARDAHTLVRAQKRPTASSFISRHWRTIVAIVGPVLALTGAWFTLPPYLVIELGSSLDPSQPFQTLFVVKNEGKLPAYNVRFGCAPKAAAMTVISMGAYISSEPILNAGDEVTKTCLVETVSVTPPAVLTISATYERPIIHSDRTTTRVFDIIKSANGYVLTPNMGTAKAAKLSGFSIGLPQEK